MIFSPYLSVSEQEKSPMVQFYGNYFHNVKKPLIFAFGQKICNMFLDEHSISTEVKPSELHKEDHCWETIVPLQHPPLRNFLDPPVILSFKLPLCKQNNSRRFSLKH